MISLHCFTYPKRGNTMNDYEDAFFYTINKSASQKSPINTDSPYRIAIADGATESSFAAEWAWLLVHEYVNNPFTSAKDIQNRIQDLSNQWNDYIKTKKLAWYAEEKVSTGAFSTVLGLELKFQASSFANGGLWSAIAVGDSCLFQVRRNSLVYAFPIEKSQEFNNSPALISSNLERNVPVWTHVLLRSGEWKSGDEFYLLTDAIAAWFLNECEKGLRPWQTLIKFSQDGEDNITFGKWIDSIRAQSKLKNDDVTCIIITV